jgi:hypothetical protein
MGATNAMTAYHLYAGHLPPTSMQLLAYMALVSKDDDARPWYGQGWSALAIHALGRPAAAPADLKAVERAISPLLAAGAIRTDRRGTVRRTGPNTARYRLNLTPRKPGVDTIPGIDDALVDNLPARHSHPPETVHLTPRKPGGQTAAHPPETVRTPPGFRGTEEPRGDNKIRSEEEEQEVDLRTELTVTRARTPAPPENPSPADPTCPTCGTLLDPDQACRNRPCPDYHAPVIPLRAVS